MVGDRAAGAGEGTGSLVVWRRELLSVGSIRPGGGVVFTVSWEGGLFLNRNTIAHSWWYLLGWRCGYHGVV